MHKWNVVFRWSLAKVRLYEVFRLRFYSQFGCSKAGDDVCKYLGLIKLLLDLKSHLLTKGLGSTYLTYLCIKVLPLSDYPRDSTCFINTTCIILPFSQAILTLTRKYRESLVFEPEFAYEWIPCPVNLSVAVATGDYLIG